MTKKIGIRIGLIFCLLLLVAAFNTTKEAQPTSIKRDPVVPTESLTKDDSIWVITDLHYLSPSLSDEGESFAFIKETSAGKELDYPAQRMEALIWQIEKECPK